METILYFYKKKGLQEPRIEPVGLKRYMLIRVGMDVGEDEWFGRKLPGLADVKSEAEETQEIDRNSHQESDGHADRRADTRDTRRRLVTVLFHPIKTLGVARRQKKLLRMEEARRHVEEQERQRLAEEREGWSRSVKRAIGKLFAESMEMAGEQRDCFCVYEDSVRKFLMKGSGGGGDFLEEQRECHGSIRNVLPSLWQSCFEVGEFRGYCQKFWVEELLQQAIWPYYIVLGTASCIFSVLERHAGRMKSLRWIVPEKDCSQELLTFVEDFYTEYGLAIALEPLTDSVMLRRLRMTCNLPVNILDFTGEPYIRIAGIAEGSVWLDMHSVEEKRRRIVGRASGITYVSLKERWKTAERLCKPPVLP